MAVFALADTHLSFAVSKPMDIFGSNWRDHHQKLEFNWKREVGTEDWVLICGDISWAMKVEEALPDLEFLAGLPGRKVLIRGNHDYWWKSISKVRSILPPDMYAVQNDYAAVGEIAVCGTRGWTILGAGCTEQDEKVYQRELLRAELSLEKAAADGFDRKVFMLHYPPFAERQIDGKFQKLFNRFGVELCIYGHLHGSDHRYAVEGEIEGVIYLFVACDYTEFTPVRVIENVR